VRACVRARARADVAAVQSCSPRIAAFSRGIARAEDILRGRSGMRERTYAFEATVVSFPRLARRGAARDSRVKLKFPDCSVQPPSSPPRAGSASFWISMKQLEQRWIPHSGRASLPPRAPRNL
jgi:hypothetical protein